MSYSRLEKFIYAICSMDVSDLPVPLSRIETLWNCLITGETPDFEPLSRNEKYLMAMLDRYDISNLPAPMSRGEKLLYKIAVGETDLSDVPGYLSRYEELLKYLIENGGISEGDFEYVLYTLNQSLHTLYTTAEKPVKSAILMGNTDYKSVDWITNFHYQQGLEFTNGKVGYIERDVRCSTCVDINENRRFIFKASSNIDISIVTADKNNNVIKDYSWFVTTADETRFTVDDNCKFLYLNFRKKDLSAFTSESEVINSGLTVKEQNLVSVKMPVLTTTGKNIFPTNNFLEYGTNNQMVGQSTFEVYLKSGDYCSSYIHADDSNKDTVLRYKLLDEQDNQVLANGAVNRTFTIENDGLYKLQFGRGSIYNGLYTKIQVQLEEGSVATAYEPYKSNILTVNENVELGGIGDVQDTLDLMTGEVTIKTRQTTVTSENVKYNWSNDTHTCFYISQNDMINGYGETVKSNLFPSGDINKVGSKELVASDGSKNIMFSILNTRLSSTDLTGVIKFLEANELNVRYLLATESIKTVDLTVVDQDNQPTELGTFENVTHVSLEAENLIPEVEMEVATNLLEDTVFTLTDAFNTLYPTAAKPVKSAILKGCTLVNNLQKISLPKTYSGIDNLDIKLSFKINADEVWYVYINAQNVESSRNFLGLLDGGSGSWKSNIVYYEDGLNKLKITSTSNEVTHLRIAAGVGTTINSVVLMKEDVDFVNQFWGMQSVKMPVLTTTGKNLFNESEKIEGFIQNDSTKEELDLSIKKTWTTPWIKAKTNTRYTIQGGNRNRWQIKSRNNVITYMEAKTITTLSDTEYIRCYYCNETYIASNVQLEESSSATSYEPYKTNILTVNEPVELRGIGDVKDTLDCLTGEVTKRVLEYSITGDEGWVKHATTNTFFTMDGIVKYSGNKRNVISDKFIGSYVPSNTWLANMEICVFESKIGIGFDGTLEELIEYLKLNNPRIFYVDEEKSVKTVDLTVVDQDDQPTQLGTFDDTTHVLLNSEGLIPTAALMVRTKIPSASSTSLLMDDISTEQQQLETTVDEQSNNVDATMIATTEIFEETL